ncbi:MAG: SBBP repeat-containing protein [Candidatus Zixiibacteriota bacterium]
MRKVLFLLVGVCLALSISQAQTTTDINTPVAMERLGQQPLPFTKNMGQWDERVKFRASAGGATIWFAADGVYYQFTRTIRRDDATPDDPIRMPHERFDHQQDSVEQLVIKASFVGANPTAEIAGEGLMEYKCNYFIGNDPTMWRTDVPNYESVTLRNVYDGVDLSFFGGADGKLVYQYSLAGKAIVDQIRLEYGGLDNMSLDEAGRMTAMTKWGEITGVLASPSESANLVSCSPTFLSEKALGLEVDDGIQKQPNPAAVELAYSTYLGGGGSDYGSALAVDGQGCAYVVGYTNSGYGFPWTFVLGWRTAADVFVTKLNEQGSGLVYSTIITGFGDDFGYDIAVDETGAAYVTGETSSSMFFPLVNEIQSNLGGLSDAFVAKLTPAGSGLEFCTFLGGANDDAGTGIALDDQGSAYITGYTESADFPSTPGCFQPSLAGFADCFIAKFSTTGNSLEYCSFIGGSESENWNLYVNSFHFKRAGDIAVGANGDAYVTGVTFSDDFPVSPGAFDTSSNAYGCFVSRFNSDGSALVFSTFLGSQTFGLGLALDGDGNVYVAGCAEGNAPTTPGAFLTSRPCFWSNNGFVSKLDYTGHYLLYGTYLGGSGYEYPIEDYDYCSSIAVDEEGRAHVSGRTVSPDFPVTDQSQSYGGFRDAFAAKLNATGSALLFSSFLGGSGHEQGTGIALNTSGEMYVTGWTNSTNFPTVNAYQTDQGGDDAFVSKISATADSCLRGTVRRADNLDPIPNATIWCTLSYIGTSDSLGEYSICGISPGYGYDVGVYASGYIADTVIGVSISAGAITTVDFELQPTSFTSFRLRNLSVDPNPAVSTLVPSGRLHRYYVLEDAVSGSPVPGAQVIVPLSGPFPTNQDGVVDIEVISMDVGSGQPDDGSQTFDISKVIYNGVTYDLEEPVSFQAAVVNQRYEFGWESSSYAKLGVSLYRSGEGFDSKISLVETDNNNIGFDSIGLIRQERDQEGAGYGIHTPVQIVWSDYGFGGGAGWEALKAKRLEDEYVFPYPNYTEMDAVNMYILFADGNVQTIDQVLIRLLSYLEVIYSGQSSLDAAYSSESKGIEFSAGVDGQIRYGPAPALANLVILNVGGDIGYGFSAYALMGYSHGSGTIHGLLGMSGRYNYGAWGGMMFPFLNDSPVTWDLSDYILPYRLGFDTETSSGVELGAHFLGTEADPFSLSLRITHSNANDGTGREKSTFYQVSGLGIIDAIENSVEEYADVLNMRSGDVNIDVSNTTITGEMGDLFRLINDVQASGSGDAFVNFTRNDCEREEISSFDFKLAVGPFEDFISASVSEKTHFEQFTSYDTLVGAWVLGKHYVLREDPKPVAGPVEYSELVSEICNKVPLWMRIAAFTWNVFGFPKAHDDAMTFFITDSTGIDTTGSLTFLPSSFPDTVTTVNCYSWGWWGSSPQTEKALLSNRALSICQRLKSAAEESRGMTYGYGGFYQFEPYDLGLEDSAWLTMKYLQSEIEGFDESELSMYLEDKPSNSWLLVGGDVDTLSNHVTALINQLGTYTLAPRLPFGEIGLIPSSQIIPADSQSTTVIVSDTIRNNDGTAVIDGTVFNVIADGGRFISVDLDTNKAGLQVSSQNGVIEFVLKSSLYAQTVSIEVLSIQGSAHGLTQVEFYDTGPPSPPILLSAIPGDGRIVVQWMSNPELDIKGYKIYFDSDNSGPPYNGTASIYGQPSPVDVGNDTVHTLTGLFNDSTYFISICAYDMSGNKSSYSEELTAVPSQYMCGDANASENVDIDDIIYIVNYVFLGGVPPNPLRLADCNCSGEIDIDDIISLVGYIFLGGPVPCDPNGDGLPEC